jgi:phosphatidylserine decarboxylase
MVPQGNGLVVSPADGRVTDVAEGVPLPKELRADPMDGQDDDGDYARISIFLSVFDVHVNRIPVSGTIKKMVYRPGLFLKG